MRNVIVEPGREQPGKHGMRIRADGGDLASQRIPGSRVGALMWAGELYHDRAPKRTGPAEPGFAPGSLTQAFPGNDAANHAVALMEIPHRVSVVADGLLLHGPLPLRTARLWLIHCG